MLRCSGNSHHIYLLHCVKVTEATVICKCAGDACDAVASSGPDHVFGNQNLMRGQRTFVSMVFRQSYSMYLFRISQPDQTDLSSTIHRDLACSDSNQVYVVFQ